MESDSGLVARIVSLLRAFAEGESALGIKQLSERLDLPPSTLHRLLDQLVNLGMVERAPHRRYRIGAEFYRLGSRVESKFRIIELGRPIMREIVEQFEETCSLSMYVRSSRQRLLIAKMDAPNHPLQYRQPVLEDRSPIWGACGRAILAHLTPSQVEQIYADAPEVSPTGVPKPSLNELTAELTKIRATGYAMGRGELISDDSVGLAAPFFGPQRQVQGGLCIVMNGSRLTDALRERMAVKLIASAYRLTILSGGQKALPPLPTNQREPSSEKRASTGETVRRLQEGASATYGWPKRSQARRRRNELLPEA